MFTWVCPQCGREVPPSYTECPDCTAKAQAAAAPPQPEAVPSAPPQAGQPAYPPPPPPAQPQYQPPPAPPPPQYAQYAPPPPQAPPPYHQPQGPYAPPPPPPYGSAPWQQPQVGSYYAAPPQQRRPLPTWLLTVLVALATVGVIAAALWTVGYFKNRPETKPSIAVESPAAKPGAAVNPYQKFIEISGVRFSEDPRNKNKILVTFMVTNHSEADISGLAANVTIWGATRKSEEDAEGTFSFTTDIHPFQSKEVTAPLDTKLKIYEMPDWQNVTTDLQVTAPAA